MISRTRASRRLCLIGLLLMAGSLLAPPAPAQQLFPASAPSPEARDKLYAQLASDVAELERRGNLLKRVVRLVKPTVVHLDSTKQENDTRGVQRTVEEIGSGVIVEIDGKSYVLTNRHVIMDARNQDIIIKLADGREIHPDRVWLDEGTDVGVMLISASDLVAARVGDSSELEIGDFVLAVGSPFGLSHSVTYGIVSAKGRRNLDELADVRYQDFLQTDAAINPGNSGGPLVNLRGEVVGVNTAIASSGGGNDGIGFTIPINMAMTVARQLIDNGAVARAFLGVHLDAAFSQTKAARLGLPRPIGAAVTGITPESPAAAANLRVDDVILQFDGVRIEDDTHLINQVSLTPVGKTASVLIFRDGRPQTIEVQVGSRADFQQ